MKEAVCVEGGMKNCRRKTIRIILLIALFFMSSYASAESKKIKQKNAEFYKRRGLTYLEKHQCDKAITDFDKILRMNSADAYAYYYRGRAHEEQGQYDLAISDYTKALKLNPRFGDAYFYRGFTYHTKGQYDQAISDYTKALEIHPEDAVVCYTRGVTHYFEKKYEKAWVDVKMAQSLGYQIEPEFLEGLRKASGRQN